MKKNLNHLIIAIVAVAFVAALTGTAAFAFDAVQNQEIHTFLPIPLGDEEPSTPENPTEVEISGVVTDLSADSITVGGNSFLLDATSELDPGLIIGSTVDLTAIEQGDGSFLAVEVSLEETEIDEVDEDCNSETCAEDIDEDLDDFQDEISEVNEDLNEDLQDENEDYDEEITEINEDAAEELQDINEDQNEDSSDHDGDHQGSSGDD